MMRINKRLPRQGRLAIGLLFAITEVASAQSCQSVYADSVTNIAAETVSTTETDYLFREHCERSGRVRSSSAGLDLTIPIKKISVGFSGSKAEALEEMKQFCMTHHEERLRFFDSDRYENRVVVDALRAFNDCERLKANNIEVSHISNTDSNGTYLAPTD